MKKKKSGKRIFAIVLLVVIGIGGFYFGYDIGRMDHDEERIRAELKKTTADSEISIRPVAKGGTGKTEIEILTECLEDAKDRIWKNIMNSCRHSMERHRIQKPLF